MPRKGKSGLPPGIYKAKKRYRVIVSIAAGRKEKSFPLGTGIKEMKRWRNTMRTKLETLHPTKRSGAVKRGTFAADMQRYLKTLTISSWASRRSELRAWSQRIGKLSRSRVTADHVKAALKAWSDAKVAPKTVRNRLKALSAMYLALDGPKAWVPSEDVQKPTLPKTQPREVPIETLIAVEQQLRAGDPKTHGRYMVLIATGCRPVHLKRATVADVDLERRVWYAHAAKGGNPIALPLNDDMIAAWQAFIKAEAWGDFKSEDYAKQLRAAGWPADVRPYNAKHSFGIALGEAGVDMRVIADWFGQTKTDTARIYVPVLASRLKDASDRMNGRLGWGGETRGNAGKGGDQLAVDVGALSVDERKALIRRLLQDELNA